MMLLERLERTLAVWMHWGFVAWLSLSAGAETWVVDRLEDAGDGSLRWAIEQANARPGEDRIQVTVEGRIRLAAPLPALSGNTVIVGPGRDFLEISGDGAGRVLSMAVGTTNTISALTIANGRLTSGENGAGIHNLGTLVLSNCVLTGNHASNGFGGAIYSAGDLTVVGCRIAKNSVIGGRGEDGGGYDPATGGGGGGGGGGGLGGGLFSASGRLLIADSEFDENSATGGEGGRTNASVRVGGRGGGLNGGIGGDVTLPGADGGLGGGGGGGGSNAPRGPRSGGNGGLGGGGGGGGLPASSSPPDAKAGVSEFGGGPGADGVDFFNSATRPGVGGGGGGLGGALFVLSGEATVSRSRFGQNRAIGGAGGRVGPAVPPINRFSGGGYGGAVFGNEGTLEILDCTFRSNFASSVEGGAAGGGAVFIRSATTSVDSSTFYGNSAAGAAGTDRGGLGQGGAMMAWSGAAKIVNCTFSDNLALGGLGRPVARQVVGTGGEAYGGALMVVTSRVDLVHCTLTRNGVRGGSNSGGDPSFYPTEIIGTASGGGFANSGGLLTLRNTLVDGNAATRYFTGSDGFGPIVSEGVNLIGISKDIGGLKSEDVVGRPSLLRALGSDSGPTPTHVPLTGSPAIDAAPFLPEVAVDQRGVSRPGGLRADIGAVEIATLASGTLAIAVDGQPVQDGADLRYPGAVTVSLASTYPRGSIFYTLDDTTPTADSRVYEGPFLLREGATLRGIGFRRDFGESAVAGPVRVGIGTGPSLALRITTEGKGAVDTDPPQPLHGLGQVVRLAARPGVGWRFVGWSGDVTGLDPKRELTMDSDKTVRASFAPERLFRVSVLVEGDGRVELDPPGGYYESNTVVRLRIVPFFYPGDSGGYTYIQGISGDVTEWGEDRAFTVRRDLGIVVRIATETAGRYPKRLQLTTRVLGLGRVVETAPYISPAPEGYVKDRPAPLRADPEPGWVFRHWLSDAKGTQPSTSVVVSNDTVATAVFGTKVSVITTGQGTVDLGPGAGETTGWDPIRLTAIPQPGHYFVRWGDAVQGTANPLDWIVREAQPTVSALFAPLPAGEVALVTRVEGNGSIETVPAGHHHPIGSVVTLVARPRNGERFLGWTGDAAGTLHPLEVRMDSAKSVGAVFSDGPRVSIQDPFGFRMPGLFRVGVEGAAGGRTTIERSTDLTHWEPHAILDMPSRVNDVGAGSPSFSVGDFIDAASLATRLKGSDDPVSTYLRSRLSAPTLSELAAWQAPAVPSDLLQTLVVRDLNGILWGPSIWTAARFQGVTLRRETRDLLPNAPFGATGAEVPRLNRFLLEDAYPLELSKYVHVLGAPADSPVFFRATRTGP